MTVLRWLSLLIVLLWPSQAWSAVQRFALIVGSNRGNPGDVQLVYAEPDAAKVAKVLRDVGAFEPADIILLKGEDATTVRRTLISVNDRIRAAQSLPDTEALLFVYYSGHADGQALRMGSSRFEFRELAELVRGSPAQIRLLVVDACRAGSLTRFKGGRIVAPFPVGGSFLANEGVVFLTATASNEDAQESDEIGGSFFTHALVSGLLGAADRDGDGTVVLEEAYRYARDATLRATSSTYGGTQHPTFRFDMKGQGELALSWLDRGRRDRSRLEFPPGIGYLVMEGSESGSVIGEIGAKDVSRSLSVPPGKYFIRGRGVDSLFEGFVEVAAGQAHRLDPDRLNRVEYARLVRKGHGYADVAHGLHLGASVRSALPHSSRPCWGGVVGYRMDLRPVGLMARLGYCPGGFENSEIEAHSAEYEVSAGVDHAWDVAGVTLYAGGGLGARLVRQTFESSGIAPPRTAWAGLGFVSLGASVPLTGPVFLGADGRFEGHLSRLQQHVAFEDELRGDATVRATAFAGTHF